MAKPLEVVLIEDNPADVYLLREALCKHAPCNVVVLADGDKAFRYFEELHGGPVPDLVVLDLNLPCKDGEEVLELLRRTPGVQDVPVAIVSSSPKDVLQKKAAQADCYITKPVDLDEYLAVGKELVNCARSRERGAV